MSKQILRTTNSRISDITIRDFPVTDLVYAIAGKLALASDTNQNIETFYNWIQKLGDRTQKINEFGNLKATPSGIIPINEGDPIASVGYVNDITKTLKHNKHFDFIDVDDEGIALPVDERAVQLYSYDFEYPNEGAKLSINYNTVKTTILGTDVLTVQPAQNPIPGSAIYSINAHFNPIKDLGTPIDDKDAVPKDFLTANHIISNNAFIPGNTVAEELEYIRNNLGSAAVQWQGFSQSSETLLPSPVGGAQNSITFDSALITPIESFRSVKAVLVIDNVFYTSPILNFQLDPRGVPIVDEVKTQTVNFFSDKFNTKLSISLTLKANSGTVNKGQIIMNYDTSSDVDITDVSLTLLVRLQMSDVAPYAGGPISPVRFFDITNDTRAPGINGLQVINGLFDKGMDNEGKITSNISNIATNKTDIGKLLKKVDSTNIETSGLYQKDSTTPAIGGFIHMEDEKISIGHNNSSVIDINDDGADKSVDIHGSLKMNSNKITDVGTPTEDTDVTTKEYVDTHSGLLPEELDKRIDYSTPGNTLFYSADKATPNVGSGIYLEPAEIDVVVEDRQVMTITKDNVDVAADMTLNDNKISNVANPTEVQDVSTKGYTDTSITKLETQTKGRYYNNVLHNLIKNDRVHTPTGYLEPSTYAYSANGLGIDKHQEITLSTIYQPMKFISNVGLVDDIAIPRLENGSYVFENNFFLVLKDLVLPPNIAEAKLKVEYYVKDKDNISVYGKITYLGFSDSSLIANNYVKLNFVYDTTKAPYKISAGVSGIVNTFTSGKVSTISEQEPFGALGREYAASTFSTIRKLGAAGAGSVSNEIESPDGLNKIETSNTGITMTQGGLPAFIMNPIANISNKTIAMGNNPIEAVGDATNDRGAPNLKQVKDLIAGSSEYPNNNNLNLAYQNTQLDNLEIGQRIFYKDYSDKSLAAQPLVIENTQKPLSIPNLNTWVNEYDFVVAENGKYNLKQLFFFKLLFTSPVKQFRIGAAIHDTVHGNIKGEIEEDFDLTKYSEDEIKEQIFSWFKQVNVDLDAGNTYVFKMTLQGLNNTIGTFSPAVYTSAPHVYDLTEKSHFELSKLSIKGSGSATPISVKDFNEVVAEKTIKTIPLSLAITRDWNKTLLGDTTEFFNFNQSGTDYTTDKIRLRFSQFSTTAATNINTTDTVIFEVSPSDFRLESAGFVDTIIGSFYVRDRTGDVSAHNNWLRFGVSREIDTITGSDKLYISVLNSTASSGGAVLDQADVEITTLKLAGSQGIKGDKGDTPTLEFNNTSFQQFTSTTYPTQSNTDERAIDVWTASVNNNKEMFSNAGAQFVITEAYRKEIKASNKERYIRIDFSSTGYVPYTGEYYVKVYSPSKFDFGGNDFIINVGGSSAAGDYRGRNTGTIGSLVVRIPTDIEVGADFTFNIKSIKSLSGEDINPPYRVMISEMGSFGSKGEKGDPYNPLRTRFSKVLTTIANGSEAQFTLAPQRLDAYRNMQVSSYIDALSLGEQNLVILDWEDHEKYIVLRVPTSEVVYAEHYSIYVYKNQAINQIKIVNKTGASREFTVVGSAEVI